MIVEQTLASLGMRLPAQSSPVANYVPAVRVGDLVFVSGHGPWDDGTTAMRGRVGAELTIDDGYQVARNVALNCLASVRTVLGDLDKIRRFVKVFGMVNCTEAFRDHPKVMNGCSDLLIEIFGSAGKHARSAVGMQSLPCGIPVEIEMILEVN